ncbi:glutamine amidotransferase [Haladaptatus sp. NG-SE-30]
MTEMEVLLAGESWHEISLIVKAQDVTASSSYTEAGEYLIAALEAVGASVSYQPCHVAAEKFPRSKEKLAQYDLVLLSDIGAQTLLLTPEVAAGNVGTNRCQVLAEYVADGGSLGMIGGYMSFAGEQGQAGYSRTALAEVLPVEISPTDDRIERPAGIHPQNQEIEGLPGEWPAILGYNRVSPSDDSEVWATVGDDPLLVVGDYGEGSSFALTTDCAEHWAPQAFLEWTHLPDLWRKILNRMS